MKSIHFENICHMFSYNTWATIRLIKSLQNVNDADYIKTLPIPFNNLHGLVSHLQYYDAKYYQRIVNDTREFTTNAITTKDKQALFKDILFYSKSWNEWINSIGVDVLEPHAKAMINVCMHNSYHRGQITNALSLLGYQPLSLDIFRHLSLPITRKFGR